MPQHVSFSAKETKYCKKIWEFREEIVKKLKVGTSTNECIH